MYEREVIGDQLEKFKARPELEVAASEVFA